MKILISFLLFSTQIFSASAQGTSVDKIKIELENSPDPVALAKTKFKKKYRIDTVALTSNKVFFRIADSLAYYGKLKKVYGPFPNDSALLQLIGKAPNVFYRASHIFIDTSKIRKSVANKLADTIIAKIRRGESSFD